MTIATKKRVLLDGVSGNTYLEYDGSTVNIVVAGTTVASWDSTGANTLPGVQTISGTLTFSAGAKIDVDSSTTTASGTGGTSTATLSKMAGIITTDAITTAAGGSHVMTITNTLVAAGDLIIGWLVGGANTRVGIQLETVAASSAITATIKNNNAAAINGTVIFGFLVLKA
jgi:hypothetical protein